MLPIPFDPTQLTTALPDVIAAIGVAFVLAVITFKPPRAPTMEEAMTTMTEVIEVTEVEDVDPEDDGS